MKVCVICREHPTLHFNGGLAIAAWNTARAASNGEIEVVFVTASHPDSPDKTTTISSEGIEIICLPNADHADYKSWHPAVLKWWLEEGRKESYDLLHCHGYSASVIAMHESRPEIPMIFHDHGSKEGYVQTIITDALMRTGPTPTFWKQLSDFHNNVLWGSPAPAGESDFAHMRRYERVIATSHISEMDYRTRYLLTNVELFYHPIYLKDIETTAPVKKSRPNVAVFAGDLDNPWKCGVDWLRKLQPIEKDIHLILIGKGDGVADYAAKHFSSSYATGHLSEDSAMRCLSKADVLYEPSTHHIGLNLTGISAIGLGVPVVAFPTAGHTDLIGDHDAGIVVDPTSPYAIVGAVQSILKNRPGYSDRARKRFCCMFHPKVATARIVDIYEDIVREKVFG